MSTTRSTSRLSTETTATLAYDVFVSDPPPHGSAFLPNGEPKGGSPVASTLIYGAEEAVLTDPAFTADQANAISDWVAAHQRTLTHIFITHGHGDHWFGSGLLAERFGARVVATAPTIAQMSASIALRPLLWDKVYPGIPPTPVIAEPVPNNRFTLEGHDLLMVEVGHSDTDDTSVLHVPELGLVVAGDVIYNGAHLYLGESVLVGGLQPWRDAIEKVDALQPRHIVAGHQDKRLDDDAERTIRETRRYLGDADELLRTETTAVGFFNAMVERYPRHLGQTVLWAGASAIYAVRDHPVDDPAPYVVAGWL
jgi:glyoxylase-like metal-dependent hydrolase (beta-lactamase superfamily II)